MTIGNAGATVAADGEAPSVDVTVGAVDQQLATSAEVMPTAEDAGAVLAPADPGTGVALDDVAVGLPDAGTSDNAVVRDGVSIYENDATNTATAVNPAAGGVQILTSIGGPDSPTSYGYPFEGATDITIAADGSATVYGARGEPIASVAAPWATDAAGAPVSTHFEASGTTLVQVVDHTSEGVQYPVLADPSVFLCDSWTHICVKFDKSETKAISKYASPGIVGAAAWAALACSKVPAITGPCTAIITIYATLLARSFDSASAAGKCVELHFGFNVLNPLDVFWWKTEPC